MASGWIMQLEKQKRGLSLKIRQLIEQSAMHVVSELRNPEVSHALAFASHQFLRGEARSGDRHASTPG